MIDRSTERKIKGNRTKLLFIKRGIKYHKKAIYSTRKKCRVRERKARYKINTFIKALIKTGINVPLTPYSNFHNTMIFVA